MPLFFIIFKNCLRTVESMFRYGIIGCGVAARVHLHYLKQNPAVEIVALCDPSPQLPPEFQALGLPIYQDYREMLCKEKLDAATIASPHYLHYEQIIACAQRGIHILCEKPLAITFPEAEAAVAECTKARIKLASAEIDILNEVVNSIVDIAKKTNRPKGQITNTLVILVQKGVIDRKAREKAAGYYLKK